MFTDKVNFLQKAVIFHPTEPVFLILKRSGKDSKRPNEWDLPGGNVIFGEVHLESIQREIREETALGVDDLQIVQVATGFDREQMLYHLFMGYQCRAKTTHVNLGTEHEQFEWVSKDIARSLLRSSYLLELIDNLEMVD
jgi:ADP-ribose pyrophosphatase YjhB (NUDIX family)